MRCSRKQGCRPGRRDAGRAVASFRRQGGPVRGRFPKRCRRTGRAVQRLGGCAIGRPLVAGHRSYPAISVAGGVTPRIPPQLADRQARGAGLGLLARPAIEACGAGHRRCAVDADGPADGRSPAVPAAGPADPGGGTCNRQCAISVAPSRQSDGCLPVRAATAAAPGHHSRQASVLRMAALACSGEARPAWAGEELGASIPTGTPQASGAVGQRRAFERKPDRHIGLNGGPRPSSSYSWQVPASRPPGARSSRDHAMGPCTPQYAFCAIQPAVAPD